MDVSKLARLAALLLLIAVPIVLWLTLEQGPPETETKAPSAASAPAAETPVLKLNVLANGEGGRRHLEDGQLKANESLRFRVHLDRPAHVLIGRTDRLGGTHLVYPIGMAGRAIAMPKGGPREIGQGLKTVVGEETLVAYACA
ncbi:MAG: hypothetical protein ACI9U2_005122, partial [Bradymonadia bacterium]